MARVKIDHIVQRISDGTAATATVTVKLRGTETDASVFDVNGNAINSAVSTNNGRIDAWVNEGSYDLRVTGAGFAAYTQEFEAISAGSVAYRASPTFTGTMIVNGPMSHTGTQLGFYNATPINQPSGWGNITPPAIGVGKTQLTAASTLNDTIRYVAELAKALKDLGLIGN